jgi:hypothetical protein
LLEIDPEGLLAPTVGGDRTFSSRSAVLSLLVAFTCEVVEAKGDGR